MNQTKRSIHSLASTFSIVAFDPLTKDLGVAVQSRYFSVGSAVPWAESGVGAVATQADVNVSYGPRGLRLLKKGLTVGEVIHRLTKDDKEREHRQLGIIDSHGNAQAFTGKKCLEWAGSKVGKNYAAQGNILVSKDVVKNMGKRFESTKGDLAERLVAALEGGEEAGGDARGRQSAALLVVRKGCGPAGYGDRYLELRVEDHSNPIEELKRLVGLHRVYTLIGQGEDELEKGDFKTALETLKRAVLLDPKTDDAYIDLGIVYIKLGKRKEAVDAFREVFRLNPKMKAVIKQFPKAGLMEPNKEIFAELGIL